MSLQGRKIDNSVKDSQSQWEEPKSADMPREQFLYETLKKVRVQHREEKERLKKRLKEVHKERENDFANLKKDFRELQEKYEKLLSERKENRLNMKEEAKGCTESSQDYVNLLQKRLQHNEVETTQIRYLLKEREDTIAQLKTEKDDLQTRLSSVAGEKLVKGNPSITDLGDPNRPMKIGEKYGELYDNEWTDAMECTNDIKPFYSDSVHPDFEEILVLHLCRLLKSCYHECLVLADEQIDKIGKTLAETFCLNINPVMYLDEDIKPGTSIDKNTYKEFVKSGNKVKYVVWPALFLHQDGPMLYKGIVQAYWQ
ncbi:Hypothetical predicted protein [Mytilus galloprovincialis]|uniref:Mitochondria-eating protein C-terminal domain-containing protein n=1 Tax=Mytilus galloprovincialis TaxID=29158 RepID=A0A8B6CBL4_MYTGA|nr:Hypothetical predicted protein [Mytilus galloprovincialis]